jgi:hypothetical protein
MRRALKITLLIPLFIGGYFIVTGCGTVPSPKEENSSLIVILEDAGYRPQSSPPSQTPGRFFLATPDGDSVPVSFNREGLFLMTAAPGTYSLRRDGESTAGERFNVPHNAVVLCPHLLAEVPQGMILSASAGADDRRRAVRGLTSYVGFEQWLGKEYTGFGPYRPKNYLSGRHFQVEFAPQPKGAELLIDGMLWGKTPRSVELTEGKYLVELKKEGFESYKRIISIDEDQTIEPELQALEEGAAAGGENGGFDVMVYPITPFDPEAENLYGSLFAGTIELNFAADPRLNIVSFPGSSPAAGPETGSEAQPDFTAAEEAGADLVVAGTYDLRDESIFLTASLYETKSKRIKYADIFRSEAGIAVFDSIDSLSVSFAEEVSRVLPETGEPIIEREEGTSEKMLAYEKSIYRRRMVDERLEWKNLLSAGIGLGGMGDSHEYAADSSWELRQPTIFSVYHLTYSRVVNRNLSLTAGIELLQQSIYTDESDGDDELKGTLLYTLLFGPEFDFRSEKSDVYFKPLLLTGFLPSFSFTDVEDYRFGPLWYGGLNIDMGYRYIFFDKTGRRPVFMEIGMLFDIVNFRYGSAAGTAVLPLKGKLYIASGIGFK